MKKNIIGIIGAYGQTGVVAAAEILKQTDAEIIAGGRDAEQLKTFSKKFGKRVRPLRVDVFDEKSLKDFCASCDILVNCAGPSYLVKDTVALAAYNSNIHYIDPEGSLPLVQSIEGKNNILIDNKKIFCLCVGWIPGLTGVLTHYLHTQALLELDAIDALEVYYGDRSNWSKIGFLGMAHSLLSQSPAGYYKKGVWTNTGLLTGSKSCLFPKPFGKYRVFPHQYLPELEKLARAYPYNKIASYAGLYSYRTAIITKYIQTFLRNNIDKASELMRKAFQHDAARYGKGGAIVSQAFGTKNGSKQHIQAYICETRHYWITGIQVAILIKLIIENNIKEFGLNYLCDTVDAQMYIDELIKNGVSVKIEKS
ncbi:MAG: NAD(P)H-binding protein [bacterium]|nr:NAD(P)H-binding protein [bacterium]